MTDMSGGGRSGPGEASGERAANQISGVVAGQNGREISRAFEAAVIGVHDVVGGATRGANELIAGATRGVNDVISKGNEFLGRGGSTMTAEEHEHLSSDCFGPDKLHPNAEGHRRWAGRLEAAMGEWGWRGGDTTTPRSEVRALRTWFSCMRSAEGLRVTERAAGASRPPTSYLSSKRDERARARFASIAFDR